MTRDERIHEFEETIARLEARVKELKAQDEHHFSSAHQWKARAEEAEARNAELEHQLKGERWGWANEMDLRGGNLLEIDALKKRAEAAEARVAALEGALRDIAHPDAMAISNAAREIALRALASHAAKAETGGEGVP